MDWLKDLLKNLPLDFISDIISFLVGIWSRLTVGVPDEDLPFYTYVGASVLVLLLLLLVIRILPRPVSGMLWLFAAAVLLTPGDTLAGTDHVAPAIAAVAHATLMGDTAGAFGAFVPILAVYVVLLFVGAIWQVLRGMIELHFAKRAEEQTSEEIV